MVLYVHEDEAPADASQGLRQGPHGRASAGPTIESPLQALGVEIIEAAGSRVHLVGDSKAIVVHRPHPRPETARATVRQIATFLTDIGVTP